MHSRISKCLELKCKHDDAVRWRADTGESVLAEFTLKKPILCRERELPTVDAFEYEKYERIRKNTNAI